MISICLTFQVAQVCEPLGFKSRASGHFDCGIQSTMAHRYNKNANVLEKEYRLMNLGELHSMCLTFITFAD